MCKVIQVAKEWQTFQPAFNWLEDRLVKLGVTWKPNDRKDGGYRFDSVVPGPNQSRLDIDNKRWIQADSPETLAYFVAIIQSHKALDKRVGELARERSHMRMERRMEKLRARNIEWADDLIEGLIDEWSNDTMMQSFPYWIFRGPAFEELLCVPKDRMIVHLLKRLRGGNISMSFQGFLQKIAGEDIGSWEDIAPGWRGYDVKESALRWLRWGKSTGRIEFDEKKWSEEENDGDERSTCYKCRKQKAKLDIKNESKERTCELICPDCGVLVRDFTVYPDDLNEECRHDHVRLWRGETEPSERD
jgi:hypothetical protein